VIVLDVGLPVLDGSGFARKLRTRLRAATPPIIVISGQPYGRAMADQIGAVAFYAKPVDLHAFAVYLHALADRQEEQVTQEQESGES
jgi:DNA-binding response OmpR family regulator